MVEYGSQKRNGKEKGGKEARDGLLAHRDSPHFFLFDGVGLVREVCPHIRVPNGLKRLFVVGFFTEDRRFNQPMGAAKGENVMETGKIGRYLLHTKVHHGSCFRI
jgi:hypothetical protein